MEPHINAGDVVLSQAMPANAPPPMGRVITFRAPAGSARSGFVLHRLVAIDDNGTLVTKGDANADPDSTPLDRRNIISAGRLLIPWIGLPAFWVTTGAFLPLGIWVLLTVGAVLIEVAESASRSSPANPRRRFRLGRGPDGPREDTHPARSHGASVSSFLNRVAVATAPAAVALVALFTAVALTMAPLGLAAAAFSAMTSSTGNTWGTAGPSTTLAFTTEPSDSTGGIAFGTQPVVVVQDAGGDTVHVSNAPVTLALTTPAGATLTCTANPMNAVAGVATFAGCAIDKAGTYTLRATSGTLTSDVSASFTIAAGPATQLAFTTNPSSSHSGIPFVTQPVVAVQDAGGNTVNVSIAPVTLALTAAAGAVLTCTANPKTAAAGVATFTDCAINSPGTYTLTATSGTLTSDVSAPLTVAVPPTLTLSSTTVKPGTTLTGSAAGFVVGETLRYRLDNPTTGTVLTGSLAGSPTPATVPAGGGGSVVVTVPSGTSEGAHTVYAVTSPSAHTAAAGIVVDTTAPPQPVLTLTPAAVSGDTVTFAYTEAEGSATVDCRLDAAAFAPCASPVDYAGLAAGSHTFLARATDTAGNVSTTVSYTWTVNLNVPTIAIDFPTVAGLYNDSGFNADCGTALTGDVCGTADDDVAVTAVKVSLRRLSTGLYWNGTSFNSTPEVFLAATNPTDWTYAINATAFFEGGYTLRAQASDGANFGYDSRTFTIDRTAPAAPALTSVPPAISGPSATLAFTTSDPIAVFECQLDAGAWTSCPSPQTYSNLSHGFHAVAVRAVDGAGNTSPSTSTTWTVDATAPTAAMTFPAASSYNLPGWAAGCGTPATGDVCGTAGDVGSGLTAVAVSIRRASTNTYWNGSTFAAASETWLGATGTASWSYLFAGPGFPADGSYTVRWRATDAVGNATTGGVDLMLDTTPPPAPQIVQAPSNPSGASVQFNFTDAEAGTGAQCLLDSGTWTTCTAPVTYPGLAAGSHTFGVRATDAAGNVSATTSHTWTVDVSLPTASISFPLAGGSYSDTTYAAGCSTPAADICGTAFDPQGSVASVALSIRRVSTSLYWNGTGFNSAAEVFLPATGTTSWSYAMAAASFPADDSYTLHARATDSVGLTGFDAITIILDRTAPVAPAITSGPSGTTAGSGPFTFTFTGDSGASFECRLDAGTWAACTSPKIYGALASGSHTFDVRAVDAVGNAGTPTTRNWTVDATAPVVGTTFPVAGTRFTNNANYNAGCGTATIGDICGTASDSGLNTVEISVRRASTGLYLTGTTFSAASQTWITATGTTSWNYALAATTFPADDTYTLVVRATDAVGNASTATTAFVIDRAQPTAVGFSTTNFLTARKLERGDTFTLTYSEAIAPASIIAGWDGVAPRNVVVRATNSGANDTLTIYNGTNTTLLPLGTVQLRGNYVSGARTFGLAGSATLSTLTWNGSRVTVTLGTASANTRTAASLINVTWTPAAGTTDLFGATTLTTPFNETDNDSDF